MRHIVAIGAALLSLALSGSAGAQDDQSVTPHPSAGLCVLLDDKGQVLDARLAQTSGDPQVDQDAVALARKLQWRPPYPKAGWLGVRITLGQPPGPVPPQALPHCSAASDERYDDAI